MDMRGRVVVVTGGCSGIGAALAARMMDEGAQAVVVADLDTKLAPKGTAARRCDVSIEREVVDLVRAVEAEHGRIDVFCSNAGVITPGWDLRETEFARWQRDWGINVMAHAYAAKAVLPGMLARGEGYLLQTVSAAGMLASPESVIYTTTKHAALALAESLAFSYGRFGIRVSALCPMGVKTPLIDDVDPTGGSAGLDGLLSADAVAEAAIDGMRREAFFILPHAKVGAYYAKKASGHEKWLKQMEQLQLRFVAGAAGGVATP